MAPDQESSSGQVVKPPDALYEEESDAKNPLANGESTTVCIVEDSGGGSDDNGGVNGKEDGIPDIDPCNLVRLDWFQVHRIGAGLANLGNSCFLNTVIQCLTYCPPLANYLLQNDHSSSCQAFDFCMMCELQKHIKEALERSGDVIKPVHIYDNLKFIAEHFQSGQQEDAHEFLRFVIENLWRASLYNYSSEHVDPTIRETTVINYIFGGYNRSQVVCLRCKKRSNTYEHFMDFILDIKHNANSLEKALEYYVKPEILDKDNAYNCPQCNALVPAEKTYSIHRAPNVATIQLKRFDYNKASGGKITKHVSYPEQLDLRPFMSEKTDHPLWYKLNAVLVHVGQNCTSGHYYCYIRNSNNQWYLMDDARVQRVGLPDVLNQQAYLLFYVRVPDSNGIKKVKNPSCEESDLQNGASEENKRPPADHLPVFTGRKRQRICMPFGKWASSHKYYANNYRRPGFMKSQDYGAMKYPNSQSSSSEDNSSHSSWNSNSPRMNGRNTDTLPQQSVNINRNGFSPKRFNGESAENHMFANGRNSPKSNRDCDSSQTDYSPYPYHSKNIVIKSYTPGWKLNHKRFNNENRRNGHGYSNGYNKQPGSFRGSFGRSASDTNLYVDNEFYNSSPDNPSNDKYHWQRNDQPFEDGSHIDNDWRFRNREGPCGNETFSQERHYDAYRWENRNGFRYNQQYGYDDNNRHDKSGMFRRKFHEKSRSADFRPRFYQPYFNPRKQTHVQKCF